MLRQIVLIIRAIELQRRQQRFIGAAPLRGKGTALACSVVRALANIGAARDPVGSAAVAIVSYAIDAEVTQDLHTLGGRGNLGIRCIREQSEIADTGGPAIADQHRAGGINVFAEITVVGFGGESSTES